MSENHFFADFIILVPSDSWRSFYKQKGIDDWDTLYIIS